MHENIVDKNFLEIIARKEDDCRAETITDIPLLGEKAPKCLDNLGRVLSMLDCAAACGFGCAKGDHKLEYLVGRATNSTYAAICLLYSGYYDQALSSARGLGEIANLMSLFNADSLSIDRWKTVDDAVRKKQFSAVNVRIALEKHNAPIPVEKNRYRQLSGYSIHADPNSAPQAYDHKGTARTAPAYLRAGFILGLNEIALPVAFIAAFATKLLVIPDDGKKTLNELARHLIESFGAVNIQEKGRPWFKLD